MSTNFFDQDFDYVDESAAELVLPPLIQWRRGDLQNQDERLKAGCFELPVERYSVATETPVDVLHGSNPVPAYLFKGFHIAIVGWRKDWFTGRGKESRPVYTYDPNVPAWSRVQVWVIIKQLNNAQFMLTFSRSNAMGFESALEQFKRTVIGPASQKAKKSFPLYAFWMPLGPAAPVHYKEQGTFATPPKLYLNPPITDETLQKLFVGKDVIELAQSVYPQTKEWADRKRGKQDDTGEEEEPGTVTGQPAQTPQYSPAPPMPQAQAVAPAAAPAPATEDEFPF